MYINKKNGTEVPNRGWSRVQNFDSYRCKGKHYFQITNKTWKKSLMDAKDIEYKKGHKVILEKENNTILNHKNAEGTWDDMIFEIAGAETATANNIRNALKHCASKPGTEVAVILFPNDNFSYEIFEEGYAKFYGLRGSSQYRHFKEIYCIGKDKILARKKPE